MRHEAPDVLGHCPRWTIDDVQQNDTERVLDFNDSDRLRELAGELGKHLQIVARATRTRVGQRGAQVRIVGRSEDVDLAERVLQQLYAVSGTGVTLADVEHATRLLRDTPEVQLAELRSETVLVGARKKTIHPRTAMQRTYVRSFADNDIVFGIGPAGTGKTYLAMAVAVQMLLRDEVRRIILCRPAVEAGEKLGFLPGDLAEKVNPYLRPLYDALHDMVDEERAARLIQRGTIEVAPLAFMRGRTLNNAFIILDEAQNTTPEQMKMFLTRLGNESRACITGDLTQVDLPGNTRSGLVDALRVCEGIERIAIVRFGDRDIVRHPLVSAIVRAYERDEAAFAERRAARARRSDDA